MYGEYTKLVFFHKLFKTAQLGRGVKPLKINFYSSKWMPLRPNKNLENILPTNVIFLSESHIRHYIKYIFFMKY